MNTPIFDAAQIDWASRLADPANAAGFQSRPRDIFTLPPIPESTACVAYRARWTSSWVTGSPGRMWLPCGRADGDTYRSVPTARRRRRRCLPGWQRS